MATYNFRFAQLQPFLLAGAGVIIGDTSITLQSMLDIDGNALSMSGTFGSIGFGTLEPGNGNLEEQICFTGLTNNANGTVTLTGVSNVAFEYPYTQTSGLKKTHAGATTFIISNTSGFYDKFVAKDDDGNVSETLTFTAPNYPQIDVPATLPTLDGQLASKKYVDGVAVAGAPNAAPTVKGIVQIATRAQYDAGTLIGSTSAYLVVTPDILHSYLVDAGSPNVIIATPSPSIVSYVAGQTFSIKTLYANTSPTVTLNLNGIGAKNIIIGGASPSVGDIGAGQVIVVEFDGASFQMQSNPARNSTPTGSMIMFAGATAPTNWLLCNGSPVSRTTYAALFSVIASTYGDGDASTTFNVPDMRGRVPVGVGTGTGGGASGTGLPTGGSALTAVARGGWKGEETHTLTTPEMPSHTHTSGFATSGTNVATSGNQSASTGTTGSTGGDGAHNNIQPVMGVNYIIHI